MQTIDLKAHEIMRSPVPLGRGKQFMVRGITADDLTFLVSLHHGPITKALVSWQESRQDVFKKDNLTSFLLTLVKDFPDLVSEVISAATDSLDDETRAVAKKLPITVQVMALNEIAKLTLEEVDGIKNLLAELRDRAKSLAASDGDK
jgi:hypothetical protein